MSQPFQRVACFVLLGSMLTGIPKIPQVSTLRADETLENIACRSIHLGYSAPEGVAFYTEMKVEKSARGTYFMAAGWSTGYFGIQELTNGKKVILFSVWDPTSGDDPKKVDAEKRVKMIHKDESVRHGRFGGEGTGGQAFLDYDWKVGETYRFLVTAEKSGRDRTAYSGYFFIPEKKEWKHLVTFSTITPETSLRGFYSFIEDFLRNKTSATQERRAQYGNGWVKSKKGDWIPLHQARFTGDSNPAKNIDAGTVGNQFFLATGGQVENKTTLLNKQIHREKNPQPSGPPNDLPGKP